MKNSFKKPENLTFLGLMLGITIVLDSTPLGAIPLGPISATIIHIPTIITGIILGPIAGFIMGTSMGVVSLLHAATRSVTVLDPLFINPLVSILPRMFIGVVAYYVYAILKPVNKTVSVFVGGMAGSLTNTSLVFLMLYLVYAKEVVEKLGVAFKVILISVLTSNAIAEALISAFVTLAVTTAYFRYKNTKNQ